MLNPELDKIAKELSQETNIPKEVILVAYRSFFQFSREVFFNIPFEEIKTPEDLEKYRTCINIPFLGKFYSNWNRIRHVQIKRENIKKKYENEEIDN